MQREKNIIKNTIIYLIGTFGSKVLVFLLLPLYTYYLSTNDYGYFDLVITTISFLIPIISMQVSEGVYRYLVEADDPEKRRDIIGSTVYILIKNLIFFNGVYYILYMINVININHSILVNILININVVYSVILQIIRGLKLNKIYSINGVILTCIILISNIVLLKYFNYGLKGLLWSQIISYSLVLAYSLAILLKLRYLQIRIKKSQTTQKIYKYSIPLILNSVSWWFMNMSDRYIIRLFLSNEANGIYAIATKLPLIVTMLNQIFYLSWQQSALEEFNSDDASEFYSRIFRTYYLLLIPATIILLGCTSIVFQLFINGDFKEAYDYIPFLYVGSVFYAFSSFYGVIFDAAKKTILSSASSLVGAICNITINLVFIRKFGIQVASISTMISFFVMWIIRINTTKKLIKIKIDYKELLPLIAILFIYCYAYYNNNIYVVIIRVIISIVLFVFVNKGPLIMLVNIIRLKLNYNYKLF